MNLVQSQIDAFKAIRLGAQVDRATAAIPQTANAAIYTVVGGRVMVTLIIGEVTTVIGAVANATKLIATPTAGTAVDICATSDINALEVGGKLIPSGVFASVLSKTLSGAGPGTVTPVVLAVGTLNLSCAGNDGGTGRVKWSLWYVPVDDGATITAA